MEIRRDVYQAIVDPTRREILDLLAYESQNVNAIAEKFPVSRQAISLHVKVLEECGLIVIHKQGRERVCYAQLQKLHEVHNWTAKYKAFWNEKLDALGKFLDNELNQTPTNDE